MSSPGVYHNILYRTRRMQIARKSGSKALLYQFHPEESRIEYWWSWTLDYPDDCLKATFDDFLWCPTAANNKIPHVSSLPILRTSEWQEDKSWDTYLEERRCKHEISIYHDVSTSLFKNDEWISNHGKRIQMYEPWPYWEIWMYQRIDLLRINDDNLGDSLNIMFSIWWAGADPRVR